MSKVKEISKSYKYWSNGCGDLFTPDVETREDIDVGDLPVQLQELFNTLWTDGCGFRCYLTELDGQYGIAFEDEYSQDTAESYGISYEEYLDKAKAFAELIAAKFPQFTVMYKKDFCEWNDGTKDSIIAVFMPYGVSKEDFDAVNAFMEKNHPVHEIANEITKGATA